MPDQPPGPAPPDSAPPAGRDWAADITRAISRGDGEALAAFYARWFDRVYGLARSLTKRDESFCLDVVQEAMLRVSRSMRPMRDESELSRWMARVVHTAALDLLRRESRRAARERRTVEAAEPAGLAPDDASGLDERIAWLRARLAELPPEDAVLLGLRFGRGGTLEGVGAGAGMSGDATHGRIRRAIGRLRALAQEAFGDD